MPVTDEGITATTNRMTALGGTADALMAATTDRMAILRGPQSFDYGSPVAYEGGDNGVVVSAVSQIVGGAEPYSFAWKNIEGTDQDAGGRFALNTTTGAITVANTSLIVFATDPSHDVVVVLTDALGQFIELDLTIPVSQAPITDLVLDSPSILESAPDSTVFSSVAPVGGVGPFTFEFEASESDANGRFGITAGPAETASLSVADTSQIVFASAQSHNIKIKITDSVGQTFSEVIAVAVLQAAGGGFVPITARAAGDTYAQLGAGLSGAADGTKFWMILVCRRLSLGQQMIFRSENANIDIRFAGGADADKLQVLVKDTTGALALVMKSTVPLTTIGADLLICIAGSTVAAECKLTVNHVDVLDLDTHNTGVTYDFTDTDWYFGAFPAGGAKINADWALLGFHTGAVLDFGNATVQGRILTTDSKFVSPGADGSGWTDSAYTPRLVFGAPGATLATMFTGQGVDTTEWTVVEGALGSGTPVFVGTDQVEDPPPPQGETYMPDVVFDPAANPDLAALIAADHSANGTGRNYALKKGVYTPGALGSTNHGRVQLPLANSDTIRGVDTEIDTGVWTLAAPKDVRLEGFVQLSNWQSASSGGIDYWDHPGLPAKLSIGFTGIAENSAPSAEVWEREDLFVLTPPNTYPIMWKRTITTATDGNPATDSQTGNGIWRRNTNTARIRKNRGFDPATQTAYLSVVPHIADLKPVNNWTASNFSFAGFATETAGGAFGRLNSSGAGATGTGGTITDVHGHLCHSAAIRVTSGMTMERCDWSDCGQYGMNANGSLNLTCRSTAWRRNRRLDYFRSWDAANMKGASTGGTALFEYCLSERSRGVGFWMDGGNGGPGGEYRFLVSYDDGWTGIFYEFYGPGNPNTPDHVIPPHNIGAVVWMGGWLSTSSGVRLLTVDTDDVVYEDFLVVGPNDSGSVSGGNLLRIGGDTRLGAQGDNAFQNGDIFVFPSSTSAEGYAGTLGDSDLILNSVFDNLRFHRLSSDTQRHAMIATPSGGFTPRTIETAISTGQFTNTTITTYANAAALLAEAQSRFDAKIATYTAEGGLPEIQDGNVPMQALPSALQQGHLTEVPADWW